MRAEKILGKGKKSMPTEYDSTVVPGIPVGINDGGALSSIKRGKQVRIGLFYFQLVINVLCLFISVDL